MERREINPTDWLLGFNINQGIEVTGAQRILYLSGQTSNGPDARLCMSVISPPSFARPGPTSKMRWRRRGWIPQI